MEERVETEGMVTLDGTAAKVSLEVEYLVLRINVKRGSTCKDTTKMLNKGRGKILMLTNEKWFLLLLKPKFIERIFLDVC